MIRKLRIRLIAAAILSLALVLAITLSIAGLFQYRNIVNTADQVLLILADNGGQFPEGIDRIQYPDSLSPEIPYESRFFTILYEEESTALLVDLTRIAAVDRSTAIQYATEVVQSDKQQGFIGNYRYTVRQDRNAQLVIFLDVGRQMTNFHTLIQTAAIVSAIGLLAVFLLLLLLSKRIVRPLAESYEKQKQFITDAGHELKTPLAIIDADAEVLSMEIGENEWLEDIQAQSKRMAKLTGNLIFLARMEEKEVKPKMVQQPFSELVAEEVHSYQALATQTNKKIDSKIEPLLTVAGDEPSLRRLLTVLLDNAFQYSLPASTVMVGLEKRNKQIFLTVENQTEPMSEEDAANLFDRFYRQDKSRNSASGGQGIGLSIAKAVTTAHKSKIEVNLPTPTTFQLQVVFPDGQL